VADTYDAVEFGRLQRRDYTTCGRRWACARKSGEYSWSSARFPSTFRPCLSGDPGLRGAGTYSSYSWPPGRRPSQVIYVTSQPIAERVFDYYLRLIPGIDVAEFRRRITLVAVSDWSPRPLVHKILERPRLLERLRKLIGDPQRAVLLPFMATQGEARLAVSLGIPLYAPDPALRRLGTKSGGREVFAAAGVPLPRGVAGIRGRGDLVAALVDLQRSRPMDAVIVKTEGTGKWLGERECPARRRYRPGGDRPVRGRSGAGGPAAHGRVLSRSASQAAVWSRNAWWAAICVARACS